MLNLDLKPAWLDIIRHILKIHLPEAEVIAYGSRVTGTAHDGSDLALVVRYRINPQSSVNKLNEVRDAFSESNLPILIDILDWSQIPESFREEIERTGVVIFTNEVRKQE